MNFDNPQIPVHATAPRAGGPENDTVMSLQDQARGIIQALLTDPEAASVEATLHSLLAAHPDDHVAVLREHLILIRGLDRAPRDGTGIATEPRAWPHS